jgi:hypothetical protein
VGAAIALGATALGGGCGLVVGFPDRTPGSTAGSGGEGGHGGAATSVTSSTSSGADCSGSTGGASTFCQTFCPKPLFCDDFETGPLEPTFTQQSFENGSAALSTAQAKPLPGQSFEAHYIGGGDPLKNLGQISRHFSTSYSSMRLSFDVFIQEYGGGASLTYLAEIDLDDGHGALLYAVPGAATIQQRFPNNTLGNEIGSSLPVPLQTWTHVDLALVLGETSKVTLTMGNATTIDAVSLAGTWTPGLPTIRLGNVVATLSDARDVFYDNVYFNAQ